jgi:hypothetical protein
MLLVIGVRKRVTIEISVRIRGRITEDILTLRRLAIIAVCSHKVECRNWIYI